MALPTVRGTPHGTRYSSRYAVLLTVRGTPRGTRYSSRYAVLLAVRGTHRGTRYPSRYAVLLAVGIFQRLTTRGAHTSVSVRRGVISSIQAFTFKIGTLKRVFLFDYQLFQKKRRVYDLNICKGLKYYSHLKIDGK